MAKKRLGVETAVIFVTAILVTVVVAMIVSMLMFRAYNDETQTERSRTGMLVLRDALGREVTHLADEFRDWSEDDPFAKSMNGYYNEYFVETWPAHRGENSFCAVLDIEGNTIYSVEYPFTSFDLHAIAKGKIVSGIVTLDGTTAALYAAPVNENGAKGALVLGYNLERCSITERVKALTGCEITLFGGDVQRSTTLGDELLGTQMPEKVRGEVINGGYEYTGQTVINGQNYYVSYAPILGYDGKVAGAYFAGLSSAASDAQFAAVSAAAAASALVLVAISAVLVVLFIHKRVMIPIRQVTILAEEMESGRFSTTSVDYFFVNDEVGMFARKLRYAKKDVSKCIEDISGLLDRMAEGDFTGQPGTSYPGDFGRIRGSVTKIEDDLGAALDNMNLSSEEVMMRSGSMAEGSRTLAEGAARQSEAIKEISGSIAEVSSRISAAAESAAQAGELSGLTKEKVLRQDAEIGNMVSAMNEIRDTSAEIEKIIKTIEDISFRTNILALNAAVEAARAGDAGKGFAVVADEVRNLASKSAEAAKSTSELISAAIAAVGKGSAVADRTAESMREVRELTERTSGLIVEIAQASREQNESIRQINSGIEQISEVIRSNSDTAVATASSSEQLSGQSRLLKEQVERFRT
ncbi:MAG: methyl-accepting chemotaxis protein [Ruminiclostridium sp.]|nr:methyl-accepting chemotaxis protein [Ruminiclostridium sp.]